MRTVNPQIVILTVAYHSQAALLQLSKDLLRQNCQPLQWLIVNNSPRTAPPLKLITNCPLFIVEGKEGEGFGAGCNRGLDVLQSQGWEGWVWLLNPDVALPRIETLDRLLVQLAELPSNALIGTAVLDENGCLEESAGWIDGGIWFRSRKVTEEMMNLRKELSVPVDWISGCSLLMKPSAYKSQPRFDSLLPLYYEDMDLCLRHKKLGAPILWMPSIWVDHQRGTGSRSSLYRRSFLSSCSYIRFLQRHSPRWVLFLRSIRLVTKALLRLPFDPRHTCSVLNGFVEAFRKPVK